MLFVIACPLRKRPTDTNSVHVAHSLISFSSMYILKRHLPSHLPYLRLFYTKGSLLSQNLVWTKSTGGPPKVVLWTITSCSFLFVTLIQNTLRALAFYFYFFLRLISWTKMKDSENEHVRINVITFFYGVRAYAW